MPKCRTCGEHYSEFGDGWDGECPTCADITYMKQLGFTYESHTRPTPPTYEEKMDEYDSK